MTLWTLKIQFHICKCVCVCVCTSSSWLWTCCTIKSMATMLPPPEWKTNTNQKAWWEFRIIGDQNKNSDLFSYNANYTLVKQVFVWECIYIYTPRGTTMSARRMVGSMYCSNAGLTNLLYCLMTPSMSLPLSVISLLSRRTRRMSESVSTKIFMSSNWKWWQQEEQKVIVWPGSLTHSELMQLMSASPFKVLGFNEFNMT